MSQGTEGGAARPLSVLMLTSEWPRESIHTSHFVRRQVRFLTDAGIRIEVMPFRGAKNPFKYLSAWWRTRQRLAAGDFDLVHAQFGQSALVAFPKHLPLIVTFRGDDLLGVIGDDGKRTTGGWVLQRLCRFVARGADAVIVVSEHMTRHLSRRVPIHVIPSGIDLDHFRPLPQAPARARLGYGADERLVLFVGNPAEARKRYDLADRAVRLVDPSLRARLVVAWQVPHAEIPEYMAACDALVFTSIQEGSPNAVKEALACNLPVVSVAVGDVAERLQGIAGCELCADERAETIAAALARVLARNARIDGRSAVRQLDEQRLTQKVIGIYRAAVNGASPRPAPQLTAASPPTGGT